MAIYVRVSRLTLNLLDNVIDKRSNFLGHRYGYFSYIYDRNQNIVNLKELQKWLIELNQVMKEQELQFDQSMIAQIDDGENWLECEEELEVIPIYQEAIVVSALRYIIDPTKIPLLFKAIKIPELKNDGIDIENHKYGYHFHYGKVKSNKLKRSNLLFTFNPNETSKDKPPLYSEYHGEAHSVSITVDTIGENKRRPIYSVCHEIANKRGICNFKRLDKEACVFYPR